ncbi:MAG: SAM-dependent methyltransferase [Hyphomicrobiaceae bacterium]|nr:SAM-dependent methyltransferase [Hyphomicrobiaceae bacterium]
MRAARGDGAGCDEAARRPTPLALKLADEIRRSGPLTVAGYMAACLGDADHGYYRTRQAIGAAGDFTTAPEISQVFGELIGLWAAVVWQGMGSPDSVRFVELGPGRGTLMADALRAARLVPGFLAAADVHLVETNPVLVAMQRDRLSGAGVAPAWHELLDDVPAGHTILIANEFLDTLPVRQFVGHLDAAADAVVWRERAVSLDGEGRLAFDALALEGDEARYVPGFGKPYPGAIAQVHELVSLTTAVAARVSRGYVAGLFIDYGHGQTGYGDTLQAVRGQVYEHPLTSPGEADLSASVDFAAVAGAFQRAGLVVSDCVTQGCFLGALGIAERTSRLMAANPGRAGEIEAGVARLMAVPGMGDRFKVLGVRSSTTANLPGL